MTHSTCAHISNNGLKTITVRVGRAHDTWLSDVSLAIRRNGAIVDRSAICRAVIDAVRGIDIDLSGCRSEAEIRELLLDRRPPAAVEG
jgi:hypothetical protein